MKLCLAVMTLLMVAASVAAAGAPPRVDFTIGDVTLNNVKPGTHIAWMAMLIDRAHYQEQVRILRGVDIVTPAEQMRIAAANAKHDQGIWTFAALDGDLTVTAAAPQFAASTRPIEVVAIEGAPSVSMKGARAELLYVRRGSAWKFSGADGGGQDSDGVADGRISIALSSLENVHGGRPAPATIENGDVILLIDFTKRRTASITVGR
ncbi:MAG TPA: hypothetical protein VFV49_03450 [Thermoanaerobaculia bacterium]|nr:hypothetical protein [Thermoanaerobaculia bacterium]